MQEIKMTCPFTGIEFSALKHADGKITFVHPLTGEQMHMNWNCSISKYNIPSEFFRHIETMTREDAQNALGVTHQRITQIITNETIPVHYVNGQPMFVANDVYEYKKNRKIGAPKKKGN